MVLPFSVCSGTSTHNQTHQGSTSHWPALLAAYLTALSVGRPSATGPTSVLVLMDHLFCDKQEGKSLWHKRLVIPHASARDGCFPFMESLVET